MKKQQTKKSVRRKVPKGTRVWEGRHSALDYGEALRREPQQRGVIEPHSYRGGKWPVLTTRRMRRYQAKMRAKEEVRNEKKEPVCKSASSPDVAPQKNPLVEGE